MTTSLLAAHWHTAFKNALEEPNAERREDLLIQCLQAASPARHNLTYTLPDNHRYFDEVRELFKSFKASERVEAKKSGVHPAVVSVPRVIAPDSIFAPRAV